MECILRLRNFLLLLFVFSLNQMQKGQKAYISKSQTYLLKLKNMILCLLYVSGHSEYFLIPINMVGNFFKFGWLPPSQFFCDGFPYRILVLILIQQNSLSHQRQDEKWDWSFKKLNWEKETNYMGEIYKLCEDNWNQG